MFFNYLKVSWRNMMKSKIFSFINIIGLSAGLTCCMLITLYILNETSYDSYQKKADNIYQLGTEFIGLGNFKKMPNTPAAMGEMMQQVFPEIQQTTRLAPLFSEDKTLLQYTEKNNTVKSFYETRGFLADSTFFRMFTYNFVEGNAATALNNPNTVVISEDIAQKFFGNEPALNKVLHISSGTNGDHDFLVTGVFKPIKYASKYLKAFGFDKKQFLVPLKKIHLNEDVKGNITQGGSVTYLYILASIAMFTLLIACINFMNLSTARSSKRSSEVGIRKVLGAEKKSLVAQFLGESLMMSMIAFVFAFVIAKLLLPAFSNITGRNLSLDFSQQWFIIVGFLLLSVVAGLLAGSYPAFYLSSFQPVKVLKGRFTNSLSAVALRKALVVFQFIISVVLIIASVVIMNQMNYLRSTDLGFAKDQQIVIPLRSTTAKNIYTSLKNDIQNNQFVQNAGAALYYPGIVNPSDMGLYKEGKSVNNAAHVHTNWVD